MHCFKNVVNVCVKRDALLVRNRLFKSEMRGESRIAANPFFVCDNGLILLSVS